MGTVEGVKGGLRTTLSREFAIKAHRYMWVLLAKRPSMSKDEACLQTIEDLEVPMDGFPLLASPSTGVVRAPQSFCFLCEYVYAGRVYTGDMCEEKCPLEWPGKVCYGGYASQGRLYNKWSRAANLHDKVSFAEKIRDLPEKPI